MTNKRATKFPFLGGRTAIDGSMTFLTWAAWQISWPDLFIYPHHVMFNTSTNFACSSNIILSFLRTKAHPQICSLALTWNNTTWRQVDNHLFRQWWNAQLSYGKTFDFEFCISLCILCSFRRPIESELWSTARGTYFVSVKDDNT